MRSISCIVRAVKYDSPQRAQDHMGIPSMTSSAAPLPKLRVTYSSCGPVAPQCARLRSALVDSEDEELANDADLDDGFCPRAIERAAVDDVLDLAGLDVALALADLLCEDDVLEVEDGEFVISSSRRR